MQIRPAVVERFNRDLKAVVTGQMTALEHRRQVLDAICQEYRASVAWATVIYLRLAYTADQVQQGARDRLVPSRLTD